VQTNMTFKDLWNSAEERDEPQRFKFLY